MRDDASRVPRREERQRARDDTGRRRLGSVFARAKFNHAENIHDASYLGMPLATPLRAGDDERLKSSHRSEVFHDREPGHVMNRMS